MRFLFLLFIVFPAIEIGIFLFLGKLIGILPTVLFMILTGIIGAAAAKKQGTEVYYKVQRDLQYGKMPGEAIADGLCIFIGGLLLMLPGFLSDLAGACLLIPFTRG
ncbi:FxsA family protein, partial [Bacillus subtilis]